MNVKNWLQGLFGGFIAGAATAGAAWFGLITAKGVGLDVPTLNWKALGVLLLVNGVGHTFMYLQKSPLPNTLADAAKIGAIALLFTLPSCAIKPGSLGPISANTNGVVSVFGSAVNPTAIKMDLTVAARSGARAAIHYDPNSKAYLQAALGVIQVALSEQQYDPTIISDSLQSISINEAHDPRIIEGVNDVLELYQVHFGTVVSGDLDKNIYARPMLEGIRDGLQQALSPLN